MGARRDAARACDGQPEDRGDARAAAPAGGGGPAGRVSTGARRGGGQVIPRPDGWRPGGPAPWVTPVDAGPFSLDTVVSAVAARDRSRDPSVPALDDVPLFPEARPSA